MNKRKATVFSILAVVSAATTAIMINNLPTRPIFIVLPLVMMGIFLFFAGYYAGLAKNEK